MTSQVGSFYFLDYAVAQGANITSHFLAQVFLEAKPKSEPLEGLIGFLGIWDPKTWLKNPNLGKNKKVTKKV